VSDATWTRLAAPFPDEAVTWDGPPVEPFDEAAEPRPRLQRAALVARLDAVCGVAGWSLELVAAQAGAFVCTLSVGSVRRAAVAAAREDGPEATADAAFAAAAELLGMRPSDALAATVSSAPERVAAEQDAADMRELAAEARGLSSEGLRMIDRLVERLKDEGQGLAAARLLVRFGGYGKDPEAARELYGALRALLKRGATTEVGT